MFQAKEIPEAKKQVAGVILNVIFSKQTFTQFAVISFCQLIVYIMNSKSGPGNSTKLHINIFVFDHKM